MSTLFSLVFFLACTLGFYVLTLGVAGQVQLSLGTFQAFYPLNLSILALTAGVLMCLYLGSFMQWATGLATRLRGAQAKYGLGLVTEAWVSFLLGQPAEAQKKLMAAAAKLTFTEQPLADLLRCQTQTEETALIPHNTHPTIGAAVCLRLALLAAEHKNWAGVLDHTSRGLAQYPTSPYLSLLHLKALLNTNAMAEALSLLPTLKPFIGSKTWSLLQLAVKGPAAHGASNDSLNHPWLKTFKSWLSTTSTKLPEA